MPAGLLPDNAVATVASLRESFGGETALSDDAAQDLMKSTQQLVDHVGQAINRAALG